MAFISIIGKIIYTIVDAIAMILAPLALCTSTWLQRQIFYAHNAPLHWGQDLQNPEKFGFLHRQVTQIRIRTEDGEALFAWLVTPLKLYSKHQRQLLANGEHRTEQENDGTAALKLLSGDDSSRLVIYFHGMAGTVGQTRRTDAYRLISSGDSDHTHVLAFDYRGFGRSSGSPTESGLIDDAVSVLRWAMNVAHVPPHRIVLCAQSLGTAVACGAVEHYLNQQPRVEFRGLVLCATFKDAPSALLSFTIGGYLPVLAPFKILPAATGWFIRSVRDKWSTGDRIKLIVNQSKTLRVTLVHSVDDSVIMWRHTEAIFASALNAALGGDHSAKTISSVVERVDMGEGGWSERWTSGEKYIEKIIVKHGGHNGIMKWTQVALAVHRTFDMD